MLPSMVDVLPAGCDTIALIPRPSAEYQGCIIRGQSDWACHCRHETGDFYALDLGGTNFRTLYVKLSDNHGEVVSCPIPVHALMLLSLQLL